MKARREPIESYPAPLQRFVELVRRPAPAVPLAEAALEIGRRETPALDVEACLDRLETIGRRATAADPGPSASVEARLGALNEVLFDQEGFSGDREHGDDPRNSLLHEVLERRLGLPVTLAVIYLDAGRRTGLDLAGIGMPGHFLVGVRDSEPSIFIDVFHGGALLDVAGCARRLHEVTGGQVEMQPEFLRPWTAPRILDRVLYNLKSAYVRSRDFRRARHVMDYILILRPDAPEVIRDRGMLAYQALLFDQAVEDLERYLALSPRAADATAIRGQIQSLRRLLPSTS